MKLLIQLSMLLTIGLWLVPIWATNHANTATKPKYLKDMVFCPPKSALKKDATTMTWFAPNGFKSYDPSFIVTVNAFLGAQWSGANVGQITCVYSGQQATFPILLVYHTLAFTPDSGNWSQNLGGYKNCKAKKPSACPFKIHVKGKQQNLFKQLQQLKSQSPATIPTF